MVNLATGEKVVEVIIASKAFGEINPGPLGLEQLELAVKKTRQGRMEAEMKVAYNNGVSIYHFPDLNEDSLRRARLAFLTFARATNQPGVFREYNFRDCRDEEEMRYRLLLIPEYRAVSSVPGSKVISFQEIKKILQCPVCKGEIHAEKCAECGTELYREKGLRYYKSERAAYYPIGKDGRPDTEIFLCKVDYINTVSGYLYTHFTYIRELPIYLGAVYILTPPVKPVECNVVLNKPWQVKVREDIFTTRYKCRPFSFNDLEILHDNGAQLFQGTGTEPYFVISFRAKDYTCLEEIGSHVNNLLSIYNSYIDQYPTTV
ncbi:hypothetical protein Tfer_2108 [Thermincola ferriacetica]|uniref:Uncharacterized protein n=1 Tax=Thermincola ferriacetica TaxID=281456 RepID=A0A0L6W1G0_9FIRM|nr:hypothetical protein [Thermincola ferriacetica]KNZ69311.1 hypothetical protein Tfer_2108 [Thermincola ferriacetica]